jgi:hypothetical protein
VLLPGVRLPTFGEIPHVTLVSAEPVTVAVNVCVCEALNNFVVGLNATEIATVTVTVFVVEPPLFVAVSR